MIVEVNEAGEIVIPADIVQAPPHTRMEADRQGEAVVLKPIGGKSGFVSSLPILDARLTDPAMTYRREDIYGPDGR